MTFHRTRGTQLNELGIETIKRILITEIMRCKKYYDRGTAGDIKSYELLYWGRDGVKNRQNYSFVI